MNGRIYDPQLGRFLQPDPVIQAPTNAQSWNAYTYVFNNPLAYTDPTGMMSERARNNVWRAAGLAISIITAGAASPYLAAGTAAGTATGMTIAAAGGFFAGYAATGTLKSAVIGAFSAALTAGIGGSGWGPYGQWAAQAVTGGVVESLQGGSFGHGFAAAGLTAAFMPQVGGIRNDVIRTAVGALIGGTISAVTGGKFANGAISGAVQGAMAKEGRHLIRGSGNSDVQDFADAPNEEIRARLLDPDSRLDATKEIIADLYGADNVPRVQLDHIYSERIPYRGWKQDRSVLADVDRKWPWQKPVITFYTSAYKQGSYYNFVSIVHHEMFHVFVLTTGGRDRMTLAQNEIGAIHYQRAQPDWNRVTHSFQMGMQDYKDTCVASPTCGR